VSLSKLTSRTLFTVKLQYIIRRAQLGKINAITWQKDVFSGDA